MENTLYYGDNLEILKRYIPDESVDLVYLDPPFKSNQDYNVLFKEKNGSQAASQIRAFEDTWTWSTEDEELYADMVTKADRVADCLKAFRTFLGPVICGLPGYDGPEASRAAAGDEADGKHLSTLRSYGQSLFKNAHGQHLRASQFQE